MSGEISSPVSSEAVMNAVAALRNFATSFDWWVANWNCDTTKFVFELIGFLISAAFVYGLVLIAVAALFIYTIENRPEPIVEYVHVIEETIETTPELTCTRLSGCKTFPNAKTEEEYCPTCVMK